MCASCLFGREASIRARPILVSNRNCATFIRTKKDSLHKTVCVNIVLVYCLGVFLYSFPRFRSLPVLCSYICPGIAPACMIRLGAYRYTALQVLHLCGYSPGPCRSIYARPGSAAIVPPIPAGPVRCVHLCYPDLLPAITFCPVSGALKGGRKMKLIFPHYYFTTYLKLFCPRKVRIFQRFAGFAEKSLKKIKKRG